jgi:hypothetical protein
MAAQQPHGKQLADYGYFLYLHDDYAAAQAHLKQAFQAPTDTPVISYGAHWAHVAAANGDTTERALAVQQTIQKGFTYGRRLGKRHKELLTWMNEQWQSEQPQALPQQKKEQLFKGLEQYKQKRLLFDLATYHDHAGHIEQATGYYQQLAKHRLPHTVFALIARHRLAKLQQAHPEGD